ncbi:MAG: carboxypeptidase-like regulatory domain-containing protein [Bacteroidetes bacterium]|nr:carboxypeptidase-like regulatory domain-containing protein [Bacteroidota bacterium]
MDCKRVLIKIFIPSIFLLISFTAVAQVTRVSGVVTDAKTKQTLPFVNIFAADSSVNVTSDVNGKFVLQSSKPFKGIKVSYVGYKPVNLPVTPGQDQVVNVRLVPVSQQLTGVTITTSKAPKYRNKDNPAVELIRQVIAHKAQNRPESYNYVQYKEYDKMMFSLLNVSPNISDKKFFKKYKFLLDNRDSTSIPGKTLLPIYLDEKLSQVYYRKSPEKTKTILLAQKGVNFGSYIDNEGLGQYFKHMYYDVDIYQGDIFLMTNEFLSPISDVAPSFYKFFITDTITVNNAKVVELSFTPRNTTDMLFEGKIYVTLDGNYAVQHVALTINKNINLNFVKSLHVDQDFEQNPDKRYHLSRSNTIVDFGLNKNGDGGLLGVRSITYKNYEVNKVLPDTTYNGPSQVALDEAKDRSDAYWAKNRLDTLTTAESKVYHNIDTLKTIPSYRRTMDVITLLFAGYKSFGPFELGPANTFYSFNPVEGFKLRLGGRTTPELSKRYYFETYAAYGFRDLRWKYFLSATYSINDKSIYRFPQNYIRASFQRDTKIPGLDLEFVQEDNFLLSFKRGNNDKYLYNDNYRLDYVHEFESHFSYSLGLRKWTQSPAGSLYFIDELNGVPNRVNNITTAEVTAELRYAPNEQFYQGKIYRVDIPNKYPIFTLNYTQGIKNVFDGQYNYKNIHLSIYKRFYLSQLGYTDVLAEGTNIFGQVPYALLSIPRANQTYAYDIYSYNLMNFLEFVDDHNASINIDHHFNGFFFNKIPLFNKLKWRETVSFKSIWGGLRNENNPSLHPSLFQLPTDQNGQPITYPLGRTPYIEGSVGIENIFKFVRVDLVRRFDYLDHPEVSKWGIRTRVLFTF